SSLLSKPENISTLSFESGFTSILISYIKLSNKNRNFDLIDSCIIFFKELFLRYGLTIKIDLRLKVLFNILLMLRNSFSLIVDFNSILLSIFLILKSIFVYFKFKNLIICE